MSEEFEKYKTENFAPIVDQSTFQERVGEPEELSAIIGIISMNFSGLEKQLSQLIIEMLELDDNRGLIITSELSFRSKINMFSSLYHLLKNTYKFNLYKGYEENEFNELLKAINRCEEQRNQIMHSEFVKVPTYTPIFRKKITAKQKGLKKTTQQTSIVELFNVADYISHIEYMLSEFGIEIMENLKPKESK